MQSPIRVALVEDQKRVREGLTALIASSSGYEVVGAFARMEQALAHLPDGLPHVLLLDINLPGMSGVEGLRKVRELYPAVQVIMLTVYGDDDHVFEAICAGACGYLLKETPPEKLTPAILEA